MAKQQEGAYLTSEVVAEENSFKIVHSPFKLYTMFNFLMLMSRVLLERSRRHCIEQFYRAQLSNGITHITRSLLKLKGSISFIGVKIDQQPSQFFFLPQPYIPMFCMGL